MVEEDRRLLQSCGVCGLTRFLVAHFCHLPSGHAGRFEPVGSVLQHDDCRGVARPDLKAQRSTAANRFIILMRGDHQHRFAKRRQQRHGPNNIGEVIGLRGQREHSQVDIAQRSLQIEPVPGATVYCGENQPVKSLEVRIDHTLRRAIFTLSNGTARDLPRTKVGSPSENQAGS